MQRHVNCTLTLLCAVSQRPIPISANALRHYASYRPPSEEDYEDILRIADQKALRQTRAQMDRFLASVGKLREAAESVPTTLRHRDIPAEYTLGFLRSKVKASVPRQAQRTVEQTERVQAHLRDLQIAGYERKGAEGKAMEDFEREIAGWSAEEQEETLKNWLYEEEARLKRLNDSAQRVWDFVDQVVRRSASKAEHVPLPKFDGEKASSVSKADVKTVEATVESKKEAKKEVKKEWASTGLADLQRQLEAGVNAKKT